MTSLGRLARRALQDDKSIRVEGEFVRWLENASDKAPEYGPIDILQMTDPEVMNSSEYFPAIYEERLPISLGPEWLLEQCSTLPSALSAEELCEQIVKILAGPAGVAISCIYPNVSLDRRENDLLDLLGFESLEFVSQLLELHRPIVEACRTHRFTKSTIPAPIIAPTLPGQSVTLNTTSSKQATRQYRKLMTKGLIPTSTPTSSFDMHGITAELQAVMGSSGREDIQLPNVFVTKRSVNIPGAKFALPMGTIHNDFVEHEEFIIPYPTDTKQDTWNINILNVNDMDPILQKGFKV